MTAAKLHLHMATGLTHVCQCWAVTGKSGVTLGFTDHDRDLNFDGIHFAADSGMSARALSATTGLSVNNTEAVGLLQSEAIAEEDIVAGHYDGAEVTLWQVQWDDVSARQVKFFGSLGEITRQSGTFQAELRGLTDALNQPQGRSYLRSCSAVLGDGRCRFDLNQPEFRAEVALIQSDGAGDFVLPLTGHADGHFQQGKLQVLSGAASGLTAIIQRDVVSPDSRRVLLWEPLSLAVVEGDVVRLEAGCDRTAGTCRSKFDNLVNFQGFPHIPGDDWLMSVPRSDQNNDGGSLRG
jgi:uncharacterized phage protein (TIGR02218 family)